MRGIRGQRRLFKATVRGSAIVHLGHLRSNSLETIIFHLKFKPFCLPASFSKEPVHCTPLQRLTMKIFQYFIFFFFLFVRFQINISED